MAPPTQTLVRPNIFEFQDYKLYLSQWIKSRASAGHGQKARLAERANCQPAYISQVLKGGSHFSVEQAEKLCGILEHTPEENDFFLLLVLKGRAGTASLAHYFEEKIQKILQQRLVLKNRLLDHNVLGRENQTTYYSHWAYCALHMAVLIPELRTPKNLARYFSLTMDKTMEVLQFLESTGLVKREGAQFFPGNIRNHLESDSPLIAKHHINWRLQAMRALESTSPSELHYSSIVGVSYSDAPKVREILVKAIEEVRAVVKDSKDEAVYVYLIDLFRQGHPE
jgi:uncharacterized protein (TIGR02147 family)